MRRKCKVTCMKAPASGFAINTIGMSFFPSARLPIHRIRESVTAQPIFLSKPHLPDLAVRIATEPSLSILSSLNCPSLSLFCFFPFNTVGFVVKACASCIFTPTTVAAACWSSTLSSSSPAIMLADFAAAFPAITVRTATILFETCQRIPSNNSLGSSPALGSSQAFRAQLTAEMSFRR